MGLFSRYNENDMLNHIALIIMAYEHDAILEIEPHPNDVGPYWILYECEFINKQGNKKVRYLKSYTSFTEQKSELSYLKQGENIKILGDGKLIYEGSANALLAPLFRKIRELEGKIKLP